jgi:hypothetical protein
MYQKAKINVDGIDAMVRGYSGRMRFVPGTSPEFILRLKKEDKGNLLRQAEFVISDMTQLIMVASETGTK